MIKRIKISLVLACAFALIIQFTPEKSEAMFALKLVEGTFCLDNETEQVVAFSNNCISGGTGCIDNSCPSGTSEAPMDPGDPKDQ